MFDLRPYQIEAKSAAVHKLADNRATLIEMATGLGKTVLLGHIAHEWPGRVLVIAHRDELIRQAADKILAITGDSVAVEMGRERADDQLYGTKVTVGSVQTLARAGRRSRFHPDHFSLIVVDEGHHAGAVTYREVLDYFGGAKRLFVTATAKRGDKVTMEEVYETVAYQYGIEPAINDGWLVPVRQVVVKVDGLDFSKARTVASDFNAADLDRILMEEKPLHEMVAAAHELIGPKQALWFCVSVAHAKATADVLGRYTRMDNVRFLSGDTPTEERRQAVDDYKRGNVQHLLNCFDDQTEILTSDGWVSGENLTNDHLIANWSEGNIFFKPPKAIFRRDREPGERMVVLETPRRSIRVTEGHNLAYRTSKDGRFLVSAARDLVDRMVKVPVSGICQPCYIHAPQEESRPVTAARIRANSYCLRQSGMSPEEAKTEAIRRANQRESLRHADPWELTEDECEFIGFWIGDGCKGHLVSGGVEYTLAQSPTCPRIVDRVDRLCKSLGVDFIKKRRKEGGRGDCWIWSFSRGTGFGPQKREGLFRLEPYLQKDGTELFWGLDERQFDALVRGWWMADGRHGDSYNAPSCLDFCGISRPLFDLMQAIGCCRGYRASMRIQSKTAKPHHTPLIRMRMRKTDEHAMTKHKLQFENNWKEEKVWCVTSDSGKVIVRRHGSVTVTGQCALFLEGFDAPSTSAIVMGRPTKSLALYTQVLGRGTRPLPGIVDGIDSADGRRTSIAMSAKPDMVVIDFAGNAGRHKIVTALDVLGGEKDLPTREYAKEILKSEGCPVNLDEILLRAQEELALEAEQASWRKAITATAKYRTHEIDPFVRQYTGQQPRQQREAAPKCSKKQAGYICYLARQAGESWSFADAADLSARQAQGVIAKLKAKVGAA